MAITLEKIYYIAMRKYKMELVAGGDGIFTNVSWLHIVEEIKYASFLTGGELVLYTGVKSGSGNLKNFIHEIRKNKACGIVINIGEYVPEVPEELIEYANENSFPIFTLPWEVHLVELSREFGSMIIRSEEEDKSLCSAFKAAIFRPEEKQEYMPYLKKNDLLSKKYFMIKCFPVIEPSHKKDMDITKLYYDLRVVFEKILNRYRENFVIFRHESYLTMIIPEGNRDESDKIIEEIQNHSKQFIKGVNLYYAVSRFNTDPESLHKEYDILNYICKMAKKDKKTVMYRDDMGLWNIIFAIGDTKSLKEYKKDNIGKLEKYDAENGTNYVKILRSYLENNCNMNESAKEFFLHRNTFAYHLNKISELIEEDLYLTEVRSKLLIAVRIKELLEE
ncbi:MAG: PucR family transcriptional regulator ligand-binding domain-containing protein [Eubacterium sp.]|nr:PucR family transcriptional regulator ligand-binding domain-containing protein [Eubacterium sp.]